MFQIYIQIEENDSLPKFLCDICFSKCYEWNKFQIQCEQSQNKFIEVEKIISEQNNHEIKMEQIESEEEEDLTEIIAILSESESEKDYPNVLSICQVTINPESPEFVKIPVKCKSKIRLISCSICKVQVASDELLEEHQIFTHTAEIFSVNHKCVICDMEFCKTFDYIKHYKTHDEFICKICNKNFAIYLSLHKHVSETHSEPKHECEFCKLKFRSRQQINLHTMKHKNEFDGCCEYCGRTFLALNKLRRHILLVHEPEEPKFQCHLCPHKNKSKDGLRAHLHRHAPNKKISCEFCNAKFTIKSVSIIKFILLML